MGLLFFLGGEGAYSKVGPACDLDISGANALEAVLAARFRGGDLGRRPGCSQLSQTPTTVAHQTKEIAGQPVADEKIQCFLQGNPYAQAPKLVL